MDVDINANAPSWAVGCFECAYGVVASNAPSDFTTLALARLGAFLEGRLELCSCKAGQLQRIYLLNLQQRMIEEARANPLMASYRGTHPEIESVRAYLRNL